jgi:methionine-rich copper-binding protein CopC
MSSRRPIVCTLALCSTLLALLLSTLPVAAHQDLKRAEPGFDEVLNVPPIVVSLWFAGELDSFESTLTVYDAHDRQIDLGDASVSQEDRRLLRVNLPGDLQPGQYTVRWTAVDDEDAHPVQGEYTFTIAGAPEVPRSNLAVVISAGVVIVAIGAGSWVRRRGPS